MVWVAMGGPPTRHLDADGAPLGHSCTEPRAFPPRVGFEPPKSTPAVYSGASYVKGYKPPLRQVLQCGRPPSFTQTAVPQVVPLPSRRCPRNPPAEVPRGQPAPCGYDLGWREFVPNPLEI